MKFLVLLLAVTVCQGRVLRDRLDVEQPEIVEKLRNTFTKYDLAKPEKFQSFVQTFSNLPWNQLTSRNADLFDYNNFRDLIRFPGGEFLQEEIDKYLERTPFNNGLSNDINLEVEGVRDILPFIVATLEKMVPVYMQTIQDPSTRTQLITRDLVKIILQERMNCPTSYWDKNFIERVKEQLYRTTEEGKIQLRENFQTLLPDLMPVDPETIDQLVIMFTQEVQEQVFRDVVLYAHGVAFKDVAIIGHKLYNEIKRLFEESWDVQVVLKRLVTIVTEIVETRQTCPREQSYFQKSLEACWDFQNLFLEREVAIVGSRVLNTIHSFLYRMCDGEDCTQYYPRVNQLIKSLISQYMHTIVQNVPMCQKPQCLKPTDCVFEKDEILEPNQMEVVNMRKYFGYPLRNSFEQDYRLRD